MKTENITTQQRSLIDRAVNILRDETLPDHERVWEASIAQSISTMILGHVGFTLDVLINEDADYLEPKPINISLSSEQCDDIFRNGAHDYDNESQIRSILEEVWIQAGDAFTPFEAKVVVFFIWAHLTNFLRSVGIEVECLKSNVEACLEAVANVKAEAA